MKPEKFTNYRQTIDKTDGIACLIMALKHFGKITAIRKELELELYDSLCAEAYKTVLPSALVRELSSNGSFEVSLSLSGNIIHNYNYYYPQDAFLGLYNEEENEYLRLRGQFELIRNDKVTANCLKSRLDNGCLLLAAVYVTEEDESSFALPENVLRWVVIYGYDNGYIYYSDPAHGNKRMKDSDFLKILETPLGEVCISVREKKEEPVLSPDDEYSALKKQVITDLKSDAAEAFRITDLQKKYDLGYSKASKLVSDLINEGIAVRGDYGKFSTAENETVPEQCRRTRQKIFSVYDPSKPYPTACSPNYELLFLIEYGGDHEKIKSLICNERNINSILMLPNEDGMFLTTYLIYAIEKKNPMTVKLLLENAADVNFTDHRLWGSSSAMAELATACIASPSDVRLCLLCAESLLTFGGNPDILYDRNGKTVRETVAERTVKETNTENEHLYCEALQKMFSLNDAGELNFRNFYKILEKVDRLFTLSLSGDDNRSNGSSLFEE